MSDFADLFDAAIGLPLTKEAARLSLGQEFMSQTRAAGPMLAGMQVIPDVFGSVGAYRNLRQVAKQKTKPVTDAVGNIIDEAGNVISKEQNLARVKKKKKELSGEVGGGIGSAIGNVASWMIPGGAEMGLIKSLALNTAVSAGSGFAGKELGQAFG